MIKVMAVAHRKSGMTKAEFSSYWKEKHGPLAARLMPGVRKYVQNHVIEIPGMEFDGDGIVETWYDDVESWRKSSDAIMANRELMEDGSRFAEMRPGGLWIVEEHVILDKI